MGFDTRSNKNPLIDGCNDFQASLALVMIEYETVNGRGELWGAKGSMFHFYMKFYFIRETNQQWFPIHDQITRKYWSYDKNTDRKEAANFQREFYNVVKKFTHHAVTRDVLANPTLMDKKRRTTKHLFTSHKVILTSETKRRYDTGEDLRGSRGIGWTIHHKGPVPQVPLHFDDSPCIHSLGKAPKPKVTETDIIEKIAKKKNITRMSKEARQDAIIVCNNLQNGVSVAQIQAALAAHTVQQRNDITNVRTTTPARHSVNLLFDLD
tara:strand:+ start:1223 stop:2020 length:798 start_codon:yes stop_codon:yes gene_type:complete